MEKEILKNLVSEGLSIREISEEVGKAPTTVRHWLDKFNLKTKNKSFKEIGPSDYGGEKYCPRCGKTKPTDEFYKRRGKEAGSVYCKPCTSEQVLERQHKVKQQCVEYKGGCCEECGYDEYVGALEFHHLNPKEKDFTISGSNVSFDKLKKEMDKCILVCANCHREIHGGIK